LYKAARTAYQDDDPVALGAIKAMLNAYHRATDEQDQGLAFDLYLAVGLLLDTPTMGADKLAGLASQYPEYRLNR